MTTGKDMENTENMPEVVIEDSQPIEAVAADVEVTDSTPQEDATEQPTVTIEGEGDQTSTPNGMTGDQVRKAWREEREKRKRKNEELEQAQKQIQEANERARRAEELAISAALGPELNPEDFIDASEYAAAMKERSEKAAKYKQTPESQTEEQAKKFNLSEDQEFHAYHTASELRKVAPDYDQSEKTFEHQLRSAGVDPERTKAGLIALTHAHGVDYAKAVHAFAKVPNLFDKLNAAPNDMAIVAVMRDAADKVKIHSKKKINSQPEPEINGSSNGNSLKAQEAALFNEWMETKDTATYNKLRAIRAKMKAAS